MGNSCRIGKLNPAVWQVRYLRRNRSHPAFLAVRHIPKGRSGVAAHLTHILRRGQAGGQTSAFQAVVIGFDPRCPLHISPRCHSRGLLRLRGCTPSGTDRTPQTASCQRMPIPAVLRVRRPVCETTVPPRTCWGAEENAHRGIYGPRTIRPFSDRDEPECLILFCPSQPHRFAHGGAARLIASMIGVKAIVQFCFNSGIHRTSNFFK